VPEGSLLRNPEFGLVFVVHAILIREAEGLARRLITLTSLTQC
jgi:hypothetical protein